MHINNLLPTLFALLLLPSACLSATPKKPKNAILLSSVKSLTLRSNAKTYHRRVSAIPQLTCKGPGCAHYQIEVMQCKNQGSDYEAEDIQWSCSATIPEEFKLGSTDVVCEGYDNRDDPFVLKGSCGVEYRLLLTDKGEEKYGSKGFWGGRGSGKGSEDEEGRAFARNLFIMVFVGVAFWILYSMYQALPGNNGIPRRPRNNGWVGWGGGWGDGGDDDNDPPPPYPGYPRKTYSSSSRAQTEQGWRPGFFSGAAGGAAAGYLAGRRANQQHAAAQQPTSPFGGWGSQPTRSSSSGSASGSGARHESTGFGSTSRR